jgi:hypothetical protein
MPRAILACAMRLGLATVIIAAPLAIAAVKPAFENQVTIVVENGARIIRSNGIPDHETGQFPGRGNPNAISPQKYEFHVPADPKVAENTTALRMQPFGVAVNGVLFDPGAAEWWQGDRNSGWQYEPLMMKPLYMGTDASHAHVQPNGAYHYHGIPAALVAALTEGKEKMVIVGWTADGFPIYNNLGHADPKDAGSALKVLKSSYRVKAGERRGGPGGKYDGLFLADYEYVAGLGDLDECNGRFEVTPDYPKRIYHYVLTEQFPFIPRMFRGTPDASFSRRGPGGGGAGQRPGGPGGGPNGGPGGRPIPQIVQALDANGDGVIDAGEMANAPEVLKKLDKNGDGKLTRDEYLGGRPGGGPGGAGRGRPEGGPDGPPNDQPPPRLRVQPRGVNDN